MTKSHQWTKVELQKIIEVWDTSTLEDMCDMFDISRNQLGYICRQLRLNGVKLSRKHQKGIVQGLIKEIVAENKASR